jgi:DnaJ-class molecular chaperone
MSEELEPDAYGRTGERSKCDSCGGTGVEYGETCVGCGGYGWTREDALPLPSDQGIGR